MPNRSEYGVLVCGALAVLYLGLAVFGGRQQFSSVPFWDMWDGYLYFFERASAGDLNAWWGQHNEHRIFLSRLLFWVDLRYLQGTGVVLIVANYVLAALIFVCFTLMLKHTLPREDQHAVRTGLTLLILAMTVWWIQNGNFASGFQSQFFLAQLLPLASFYLVCVRSASGNDALRFVFACALGVAAAGSMANGVLTLPLMLAAAVVLGIGWKRTVVLFLLALIVPYLYFQNYTAPPHHGSLRVALAEEPLGLLRYTLLYLGGPIYYATGSKTLIIGEIAGVLLAAGALFSALQLVRRRDQPVQLALITFLVFIGASAFATAGGRLIFGLDTAVSSRYMTPALVAWSALLVLYAPTIAAKLSTRWKRSVSFALVPLLLLPEQLKALDSHEDTLFEREGGALALELGVRDADRIGNLYPSMDTALAIAAPAVQQNLTIFGLAPIKDAQSLIGTRKTAADSHACVGSLEESAAILGELRFTAVRGWIFDPVTKRTPKIIHMVDNENTVVGYALSGQRRADVEAAAGSEAGRSGFKGYLVSNSPRMVRLEAPEVNCHLDAVVISVVEPPTAFQRIPPPVPDWLALKLQP